MWKCQWLDQFKKDRVKDNEKLQFVFFFLNKRMRLEGV
jgi:hypothetical protein